MKNKIRIISDGTATGTNVFACNRDNGIDIELDGIERIEFMPILPHSLLEVRITFLMPQIDVIADLSEEPKCAS